MARNAREISSTGIYHIVAGSKDSRLLFYTDEDYMRFAEILERYRDECNYDLFAWCLMSNHFHILISTGLAPSTVMKKIINSYLLYYNSRYMNKEPLMRDRFKSEVIEDRGSFLSVIRYIYNSPVRAGICDAVDYPWNSFRRDGYRPYDGPDDSIKHIDLPDHARLRDDELDYYIGEFQEQLSGLNYPQEEIMKIAVIRLHQVGASIRQLARVTGLNRGKIERILASKSRNSGNKI